MSWVRAGAADAAHACTCRVGVDCGSKTVKVVVLGGSGEMLYSSYLRHRTRIADTLRETLADLQQRLGSFTATYAVTGSAGMRVAEELGMPFIQEVVATKTAVRARQRDADVVIELGGEDSKIVFLTGGEEARMNSSCAGGTGGFLDTMAGMLETNAYGMAQMALESTTTYPIASRCCVFAQNDVRGLLNEGASKADIAASSLQAVVNQCVGGLACGRTIAGRVVFLGGPLHFLPPLVDRFRETLGLAPEGCIVPEDGHLYPALGAALCERRSPERSIGELVFLMRGALSGLDGSIGRLEPLFSDEEQLRRFDASKGAAALPRHQMWGASGPLYLGLDSGSTSMKAVLVDGDGAIVWDYYKRNNGDTLTSAKRLLAELYRAMSAGRNAVGEGAYLARAYATGYGEAILRDAFRMDGGVVETVAHLKAAQALRPDVDAVLDIGGQDIKWMRLRDGVVDEITLNEACSSGCGALLGGFAHNMQMSDVDFARAALLAQNPVDLGMRCTVFMTSRVRHAQKAGATAGDISAGLAYSVARNALFKVMNFSDARQVGSNLVVSGGAFKSDALLRALEKTIGETVIRSDAPELMGAYGAALCARAGDEGGASSMLDAYKASTVQVKRNARRCAICGNGCALSETVVTYDAGEERVYNPMVAHRRDGEGGARAVLCRTVTGNRCSKPLSGFVQGNGSLGRARTRGIDFASAVDPFAWESLIRVTSRKDHAETDGDVSQAPDEHGACGSSRKDVSRECPGKAPSSLDFLDKRLAGITGATIGIPRALSMYEEFPFWHAYWRARGCEVVLSDPSSSELATRGAPTVPSESACHPVKLLHGHILNLLDKGVDAIFWPQGGGLPSGAQSASAPNRLACPVQSGYAAVIGQLVSGCRTQSGKPCRLVTFQGDEAAAEAGQAAMAQYRLSLAESARKAIENVRTTGGRGVVLACRPYHLDPEVHHGLIDLLCEYGLTVVSSDEICAMLDEGLNVATQAETPWQSVERERRAAEWCVRQPDFELIELYSFGCGVDATGIDGLRHICERSGRVFSAFKIDEMVDMSSLRIRIRSLLYAIGERSARSVSHDARAAALDGRSAGGSLVAAFEDMPRRRVLLPDGYPCHLPFIAKALEDYGFEAVQGRGGNGVDAGLSLADNDLCHTMLSTIGQLSTFAALPKSPSGDGPRDPSTAKVDPVGANSWQQNRGMEGTDCEPARDVDSVAPGRALYLAPYLCPRCCSWGTDRLVHELLGSAPPEVFDLPRLVELVAQQAPRHGCEGCVREHHNPSLGEGLAEALVAGDLACMGSVANMADDSEQGRCVGVVGAVSLTLSPSLNNRLFDVIAHEGVRPIPPSLTTQVIHASLVRAAELSDAGEGEAPAAAALRDFAAYCKKRQVEAFSHAEDDRLPFVLATAYDALVEAAARYHLDQGIEAGLGWLAPASMLALADAGIKDVLFAQTFACLGSHVSGAGMFRFVRTAHPGINLGSVEYDSGISEVNQLNRIKLLLSRT